MKPSPSFPKVMSVFWLSNNYFRSESKALSQSPQMRVGFGILWEVDCLVLTLSILGRGARLFLEVWFYASCVDIGRIPASLPSWSFLRYSILKSRWAIFNENMQMFSVVPPPSSIFFFIKIHLSIYLLCMCACMHVPWCHDVHVALQGHHEGVGTLLLP